MKFKEKCNYFKDFLDFLLNFDVKNDIYKWEVSALEEN